jgi:putative flippase GtrA
MNVVVTQTLLQSFYRFTPIGAAWANILAVGLSSLPAFVILRRWVWDKTGDCSVTREIIPFWTYSFLGLIVSTAAVATGSLWYPIITLGPRTRSSPATPAGRALTVSDASVRQKITPPSPLRPSRGCADL